MVQRNLIDTGITCGKLLVVLVGQKKVVAIPVKNVQVGHIGQSSMRGWQAICLLLSGNDDVSGRRPRVGTVPCKLSDILAREQSVTEDL